MARVLIIAPNWIGDAVMTEPLLKLLKSQGHAIDVLATPWVAPIYEACDSVDNVLSENFQHGKLQLALRLRVAQALKKQHYSICYILPNSWKSIIIPLLASIPQRVAYAGEARQLCLTQALKNPDKLARPSMVAHYLALAQENRIKNTVDLFPQLVIPPKIIALSAPLAQRYLPNARHFYIMAPGAEYGPAKQWPAQHFADLANLILDKNKESGIFLLGSAKDVPISEHILSGISPQNLDRIHHLCGQIPLATAMGLVSLSQGLISNDSGMMHIAAALKIPQIAIFGSSDPKHTPPLSKLATILYLGLDCSPCHQRQCPLNHLNCLVQITPESVFHAFHLLPNLKG